MGQFVTQYWPPGEGGHAYEAYVPHMLTGWRPQLSRRVSDRVRAAEADITETSHGIRSQLSYQWAADSIMAQGESLSSSAIEGIYASLAGMSMAREGSDAASKAALGNWEMSEQALAMVEDDQLFTLDDLLELHSTLMSRTDKPHLAGQLRSGPVWIGAPAAAGLGPIGAQFVPPPPEAVEPLLEDLVDYINFSEHSPALRAAIAHAQFETIHPFLDGNGRTGRALIQIALFRDEVEGALHLPVSRGLVANRSGYYDSLQRTRYEGPPYDEQRSTSLEPWIEMLSDSIQRATEQVRVAAQRTELLMKDWQERLGTLRSDSAVWKISSRLAYQPVFTVESIKNSLAGETSLAAIRRGISRLKHAGIIEEFVTPRRTRLYRANEIITLAEQVLGIQEATSRSIGTRTEDWLPSEFIEGPSAGSGSEVPFSPIRQSTLQSAWLCSHEGKRSMKPCILRAGHSGQHRY